ncbi:hypothetical protein F3I16_17340 [Pseudomonas sp. L-22-4S-12]|uniref:hypothetical protein n=1 Tax=Pseudomonas sp. L-22-4S-12 TaxID=2610893 RepID=UPI001320D762|nr:hypothetical protein [Pseudomonas sp. L-22-4S-12]MWV17808.1 hypothetical protein [Pseudomonas sp. L-22-4S-12]
MKRILSIGPALAVVVGSLGGCAAVQKEPNDSASSQMASLPVESEAQRIANQRVQEDIAGVKVLIVVACSEKLSIPTVERPEDLATVKKCSDDQLKVIGNDALARIEARELSDSEVGPFMLNQAAAFLQANSEAARARDPAELIKIAREGGGRLFLSKPE